jgi:hypothetical protein
MMYDSRWVNVGVLIFWLVSVGWLVRTKVLPYVRPGETPDQGIAIPDKPWSESLVAWEIYLGDRQIGTASNRAVRRADMTAIVISRVDLEDLPVEQLAKELLGPVSGWMTWGTRAGDADLKLDITVETEMTFDAYGQADRLRSDVDLSGIEDLLQLRGQFSPNALLLSASSLPLGAEEPGQEERVEVFRRKIPLPEETLVVDAFSPSPRLQNLSVGQEWSYRAIRPFPPGNPWQIVQARVQSLDSIEIQGRYESVFRVTFTDSQASSLTASIAPFSTLWVRLDGAVLRQQFSLGGSTLTFERLIGVE